MVSRYVKQRTGKAKLWECGNAGQFWKGTRIPLGDPQRWHRVFLMFQFPKDDFSTHLVTWLQSLYADLANTWAGRFKLWLPEINFQLSYMLKYWWSFTLSVDGHFWIAQEQKKRGVAGRTRLQFPSYKNANLSSQPWLCSFVLAQFETSLLNNNNCSSISFSMFWLGQNERAFHLAIFWPPPVKFSKNLHF